MKARGRPLFALALTATLVFSALGCETSKCKDEQGRDAVCAKSLTRFLPQQNPAPVTTTWSAGTPIKVLGLYGNITVRSGASGAVEVAFKPFDYRAYDAEAQARDELANNLITSVATDADGTLVISTARQPGSSNGLGADIDVKLPSNFDALLKVRNSGQGPQNPGDVDIQFVGSSPRVEVINDALVGSCTVMGAPSLKFTEVTCVDETMVSNVNDTVNVATTGLIAPIQVTIASISASAGPSSITAADSDISVTFPASAQFSVNATATGGAVSAGSPPSSCMIQSTAPDASTITCGAAGGPEYSINTGDGNINVSFQ
ncbi:MAG TPA: hypothetical protein VGJ84_10995 [Polyangiaceae bacterium]